MRSFSLSRRGLLGGAVAVAVASSCDKTESTQAAFDPKSWDSVRAQFSLDTGVSHFAAFVFASPPAPVRAAIARHRDGFEHNTVKYLHSNEIQAGDAIRAGASGYLGVKPEEISFTDSTTMGLGLLYGGLMLKPGDEVLTSEHDFYATHEALRLREQRDGIKVRRVRLYADPAKASVDEIVGNLSAALTPATKVAALTWVHSGTGVKLPVRQIADAIAGRALLVLDSVHGFGAEDAGPAQLGCDFLVSGCHKWLFGPRGTGLVWGKPSAWERYVPCIPTFEADVRPSATPGGYHAFEHQWALKETFEFHRAIGRDRIAARIRELNGALKDGLAGIQGVKLITPRAPELSAGIVCVEASAYSPAQAVRLLEQKGVFASATPYRPSYLRFGASIATLEADVDKALAAVRGL
jgi:selenocysteine lyase/cysteine desulfurase